MVPTHYSHTAGPLFPYDPEATPVQRCLLAAVTAAQEEPYLVPLLGPAMPTGRCLQGDVDKVFEHVYEWHKSLARAVGLRHPYLRGWTRQISTFLRM